MTLAALLLLTLSWSVERQCELGSQPEPAAGPSGGGPARDRGHEPRSQRGAPISAGAWRPGCGGGGLSWRIASLNWDSIPRIPERREQAATRILAGVHLTYVEYTRGNTTEDRFYLNAQPNLATPIAGDDWALDVSSWDRRARQAGPDSVMVLFDSGSPWPGWWWGDSRPSTVAAGAAAHHTSSPRRNDIPAEDFRLEAVAPGRRGVLLLQSLNGQREGDTVEVENWSGKLLLGRAQQ